MIAAEWWLLLRKEITAIKIVNFHMQHADDDRAINDDVLDWKL